MVLTTNEKRCIPCEDGLRLVLIALVLRVGWALASGRFWGYNDDGAYDDGVYLEMARSFLGHGGLTATHPPGYPLFLAPFLAAGGDFGLSLGRWASLLISSLTPVLGYRLATSLRASRSSALVTGLFLAFNPMLIYFSARMMSESLFVALVTSFFLVWIYAWQSGRITAAVLAGVLGALASLTRGVMLPFGGILALIALWRHKEQPRWVGLIFACGFAWAAAMTPWTWHNWRTLHRFVPVSVQGGWNFYEGLTVDAEEIRYKRAQAMGDEVRTLGLTQAVEQDAYFSAKANAWIKDHPMDFARLVGVKFMRFWRIAPELPHGPLVRVTCAIYTLILFGAALLGARKVIAVPGTWFVVAWIIHLNIIHAVFASNLRYRLPIEPMLALFSGAGLSMLLAWLF